MKNILLTCLFALALPLAPALSLAKEPAVQNTNITVEDVEKAQRAWGKARKEAVSDEAGSGVR